VSEAELSRAIRNENRRRRLKGERCISCGATEISVLQTVTLCASCRLLIQNGAFFERHHVIGRRISTFTIPIPANVHAILTDMARDHPREIGKELKSLYAFKDALEFLHEITVAEIEKLESEGDR